MVKIGFFESSILLFKSRKEIMFAVTWTAALAAVIAGKGFPPIYDAFLSIMALMFITLSVYIYNDTVDREIDSKSDHDGKKGRPISNGKVTVSNAMRFVYLTGALGLGLCLISGKIVFVFGFTYYALLFLYSYPLVRFKTIYVIKNLVMSSVLPASFLISAIAVEKTVSISIAFLAFTYFLSSFLVLPAIEDMSDYKKDSSFNLKTIGNQLTWKQNLVLFNLGIIIIILCGGAAHILLGLNPYVPLILCEIGLPVMAYTYMIRNESGSTASYKLRPGGYGLMLLTPLILALGSVF